MCLAHSPTLFWDTTARYQSLYSSSVDTCGTCVCRCGQCAGLPLQSTFWRQVCLMSLRASAHSVTVMCCYRQWRSHAADMVVSLSLSLSLCLSVSSRLVASLSLSLSFRLFLSLSLLPSLSPSCMQGHTQSVSSDGA